VAHKTGNLPGLLHDAGWIEHERGAAVVVAFSDQLANDGDGAAALAAIGEAVWQWLSAADQPDDIPT
jgi:beta-lactamase class A